MRICMSMRGFAPKKYQCACGERVKKSDHLKGFICETLPDKRCIVSRNDYFLYLIQKFTILLMTYKMLI